jgi:hypothetical protein
MPTMIFTKGLKMKLSENNILDLKMPSAMDCRQRARHHSLPPKKYLDFIEMGLKTNRYIKKYVGLRMKQGPTVRFEL